MTHLHRAEKCYTKLTTIHNVIYGHVILRMVLRGRVKWTELSFSKEELQLKIEKAETIFRCEVDYKHEWGDLFIYKEAAEAKYIIEAIANGRVFWGELSFTKEDLKKKIEKAHTLLAEKYFKLMDNDSYRIGTNDISIMIVKNEVRWCDLSFTEHDLIQKIEKVHIRSAEETYSNKDESVGTTRDLRRVLNMINSGLITWESLTFTKTDIETELLKRRQINQEVEDYNFLFNSS
jgi:hypothetical protein